MKILSILNLENHTTNQMTKVMKNFWTEMNLIQLNAVFL